jgi:hypothetical protein
MRELLDDVDQVRAQFLRVSKAQTQKAAKEFVAVLCRHLGTVRVRALVTEWEEEQSR